MVEVCGRVRYLLRVCSVVQRACFIACPHDRFSICEGVTRRRYSKLVRSNVEYDYNTAFNRSISSPEDFWAEAAEQIDWYKKWNRVIDNSNPPFTRWFVGGELNTCYNALDRHVLAGNGDHPAIIYDSPVTNVVQHLTYRQMLDEVSRFAGVLRKQGVKLGDRVLIYMPMVPQAIVVMLACARLGAIHSLVFGGFAAKELSIRINHAEPSVVVSANCGIEPGKIIQYKPILDDALNMSEFKPRRCIIYNRPQFDRASLKPGRDLDYMDELSSASPVDAVPVPATAPVYLLYTSGTTGEPKAAVRPSGGHAVALKWSMYNIYGLRPKEVWWAASDLGWVVGHSYICYAPLLNGNTSILFEGKPVGTPDPGTFFRVLKEHDVASMFVSPTAIRAIRQQDPEGQSSRKYMPLDKFRILFVAGEHCDCETLEWSEKMFESPVLDNWWQTETGWAISSSCIGLKTSMTPPTGTAGMPVPGWNVRVVREDGSRAEPHELGEIVVKQPLPPGCFSTLWKNDERFQNTYFKKYPGYYDTMDAGYQDESGYVFVMSRSDDVINVAGHRFSTAALEEAILLQEDIVESAVVGLPDKLKGQVPLGLCVLKEGVKKSHEEVIEGVIKAVRDHIGAVAAFKQAIIVPNLPKTRSGKIARSTIAKMAAGKPFKIPPAIEDYAVYEGISSAMLSAGFKPGAPTT